jgi:hypothetical protein
MIYEARMQSWPKINSNKTFYGTNKGEKSVFWVDLKFFGNDQPL